MSFVCKNFKLSCSYLKRCSEEVLDRSATANNIYGDDSKIFILYLYYGLYPLAERQVTSKINKINTQKEKKRASKQR